MGRMVDFLLDNLGFTSKTSGVEVVVNLPVIFFCGLFSLFKSSAVLRSQVAKPYCDPYCDTACQNTLNYAAMKEETHYFCNQKSYNLTTNSMVVTIMTINLPFDKGFMLATTSLARN